MCILVEELMCSKSDCDELGSEPKSIDFTTLLLFLCDNVQGGRKFETIVEQGEKKMSCEHHSRTMQSNMIATSHVFNKND